MDEHGHHMLGENSPMHSIGDAVANHFDFEDMTHRAMDRVADFAKENPRTTAALAGAGALGTAVALAPELSVGGVMAGGLAGLEAMGVDTGLAGVMGVIA